VHATATAVYSPRYNISGFLDEGSGNDSGLTTFWDIPALLGEGNDPLYQEPPSLILSGI